MPPEAVLCGGFPASLPKVPRASRGLRERVKKIKTHKAKPIETDGTITEPAIEIGGSHVLGIKVKGFLYREG